MLTFLGEVEEATEAARASYVPAPLLAAAEWEKVEEEEEEEEKKVAPTREGAAEAAEECRCEKGEAPG